MQLAEAIMDPHYHAFVCRGKNIFNFWPMRVRVSISIAKKNSMWKVFDDDLAFLSINCARNENRQFCNLFGPKRWSKMHHVTPIGIGSKYHWTKYDRSISPVKIDRVYFWKNWKNKLKKENRKLKNDCFINIENP